MRGPDWIPAMSLVRECIARSGLHRISWSARIALRRRASPLREPVRTQTYPLLDYP
jgi:hypothetical protein